MCQTLCTLCAPEKSYLNQNLQRRPLQILYVIKAGNELCKPWECKKDLSSSLEWISVEWVTERTPVGKRDSLRHKVSIYHVFMPPRRAFHRKCYFLMHACLVAQSCPTLLRHPCSLQALLFLRFSRQQWVAISCFRGSSQPRD